MKTLWSLLLLVVSLFTGSAERAAAQSSESLTIDSKGNVDISGALTTTGTVSGVGLPPPCGIIMYSGSLTDSFLSDGSGQPGTTYEGWQIANGNNGAPDLTSKFVLGTDGQAGAPASGMTGGSATVTLTTDNMPGHNHDGATGATAPGINMYTVYWGTQGDGVSPAVVAYFSTLTSFGGPGLPSNRPNLSSTEDLPPVTVAPHVHSVASQGSRTAFSILPSYIALAYIMRQPPAGSGIKCQGS